ncbi:hypothetical protein LZ30DRAFT_688799 [Colletotrichum cereale]|nr:hypothetical protein LZ30DRAFT_688799 [Colletotrichum cereale]
MYLDRNSPAPPRSRVLQGPQRSANVLDQRVPRTARLGPWFWLGVCLVDADPEVKTGFSSSRPTQSHLSDGVVPKSPILARTIGLVCKHCCRGKASLLSASGSWAPNRPPQTVCSRTLFGDGFADPSARRVIMIEPTLQMFQRTNAPALDVGPTDPAYAKTVLLQFAAIYNAALDKELMEDLIKRFQDTSTDLEKRGQLVRELADKHNQRVKASLPPDDRPDQTAPDDNTNNRPDWKEEPDFISGMNVDVARAYKQSNATRRATALIEPVSYFVPFRGAILF